MTEPTARDTQRTPYGVVPAGCRLVLTSENMLDSWGARTVRGDRITVEWGEPTEQGWYEPVFTVHSDDTLAQPEAAGEAGLREAADAMASALDWLRHDDVAAAEYDLRAALQRLGPPSGKLELALAAPALPEPDR